jgi:ABC-type glycerol-3-phosphate transport system substrate-binding protein
MKELRPFQIGLLAAFALLALVGLFMFANYSGGGGDVRTGEVTIWGTLPASAVEAGIQELTAADDSYSEVEYREVPAASFGRELADAIAEGAGPDLVLISQEELHSERGKLAAIPYESLPERTFVDSFVPEFELFLSPAGAYGVPLTLDPLVLYYNRTILASAGVAGPPTTWEAVAGLAGSIVKRDQAGVLSRSLVPFGSYQNVTNARAILSLLLLQAGSKVTVEDERGVHAALSSESSFGRPAAESAVTYFAEFGDPSKLVYSWNQAQPSSKAAFLAGDLALYPGFASELSSLQAAAPNLDFDMALIPQPGTASSRATYGRAYALALTKASDNAQGALKVAYALSADKPARAIAQTQGAAPARRALLAAPASDRFATLFYPEALVAKGWLSPSPSATDAIFSAMIGNMTTGREEAPQALEAATRALDAALR